MPAEFSHYARTLGLFRRVARISLWVAAIAVISLLMLILLIDVRHPDYLKSLQALALTRRNLEWTMALAAAWLIGATAITTWLITLYSSFRLAGPLYRFSRDLHARTQGANMPLLHIRKNDYLQEECLLLDETLLQITQHHDELRDTVKRLHQARLDQDQVQIDRCKQQLHHLAVKVITDE